jgi:hypothetical protein
MRHLSFACTLALLTPFVAAQNCFEGNLGTLISPPNPQDIVLPIQSIGFAFPVNGVTYTDMHITDHGYIQLSNGGVPAPIGAPAVYTPTTANLVGGSPKICALYADIIGLGGGEIYVNSSATQTTITWRNMQNFGFATPRFDFQLTLYPNGDFRVVYGPNVTNVSTFGVPSDNGIVGATPGGGASIPASSDVSAGGASVDPTVYELWTVPNSFDLASSAVLFVATNPGYTFVNLGGPANCGTATPVGSGCDGMTMAGVGQPTLGNSAFALRISNVPAISPFAFVAFGDSNPSLDLTIIGMPGCTAYTNLSIGLFTSGPVVSGVSDFALAIPSAPVLVGTVLESQGVALSTSTQAGLAASNGVTIFVGFGH